MKKYLVFSALLAGCGLQEKMIPVEIQNESGQIIDSLTVSVNLGNKLFQVNEISEGQTAKREIGEPKAAEGDLLIKVFFSEKTLSARCCYFTNGQMMGKYISIQIQADSIQIEEEQREY